MLTMFEVYTQRGLSYAFPLNNISSGYIVESVDGLDPVKATIVSSSFALLDGTQYQFSRREDRNIRIRLRLSATHGNKPVSELRQNLYSFFMPKFSIDLKFHDSNDMVYSISGRVESLESVLFSKDPAVDISVICFDPDFRSETTETISGSTTSTTTETLVEYAGTTETGFIFTLYPDRTLSQFTIYNRSPNNLTRQFDFGSPLIAGDVLTINTTPGSKGASRLRDSVITSALHGVSLTSTWLDLTPGDNHIRVYATGASIPYTIEYSDKYGGL